MTTTIDRRWLPALTGLALGGLAACGSIGDGNTRSEERRVGKECRL